MVGPLVNHYGISVPLVEQELLTLPVLLNLFEICVYTFGILNMLMFIYSFGLNKFLSI
jgi:hypothetical protein